MHKLPHHIYIQMFIKNIIYSSIVLKQINTYIIYIYRERERERKRELE
jgi:hypothetical protein